MIRDYFRVLKVDLATGRGQVVIPWKAGTRWRGAAVSRP